MFKVSLLPAQYRKQLEGKKKRLLVVKMFIIALICLAIVASGVWASNLILNKKLDKINLKNQQMIAQVPGLQKFQNLYNSLQQYEGVIKSISPGDPDAVKFLTMLSKIKPDFAQIESIEMSNWQTNSTCILKCTVQNYEDVETFKKTFQTDELKKIIPSVQITDISRNVNAKDNTSSVSFNATLSVTGIRAPGSVIPVFNAEGEPVTDSKGKAVTTVVSGESKTENKKSGNSNTEETTKKKLKNGSSEKTDTTVSTTVAESTKKAK
ncbi:MAG: PilN domain-containing protein [Candidatus Fimenecus sp.]